MNIQETKHTIIVTFITLTLALAGLSGYLYYELDTQSQAHQALIEKSANREQALTSRIDELETRYNNALEQLELTQEERQELAQNLEEERERVDEIEDEYENINSTVTDLLKLSNTDEELLQKYSKVYFLNENYVPSDLTFIDDKYLHGSKPLQIHDDVWPFLEEMLEDAEDDDMNLRIISAYRSFDYQESLKERYVTIYGSGANQFSADQGYSEHQLGTTIDFTTPALGSNISAFDTTKEFEWLQENAHKYGFTLSYPPNNTYYQYEPWHWRFVGEELADDLYDDEQYFYDLPQREINEYLLEIFD